MQRSLRFILAIVALGAAACAARAQVSSHVAAGLDFSHYRTYAWGPADALPTGDPRLDANPLFKDQLQGAVERRLAARGLEMTTAGTAQLLIHYHATIVERMDVDRLDRAYGYCGEGECGPPVIRYEAGTIVLDVIDVATNRLIWRGWAQNRADDLLSDPDRFVKTIEESVARMIQRLP